MRLLFDQNISYRIIKLTSASFPDSEQVRNLGLVDKSDIEIWEFAKKNNFHIVTFDSDFNDIANIRGIPPKIIWLRTGNTSTLNIAHILNSKSKEIKQFLSEEENNTISCLEING